MNVNISKNLSKSAFFEGVGHFERKFPKEGASPTNCYWCQKTRVIVISCGVKIFAIGLHCLILLQSTRVTDRQTDGQTDRQTELRLPNRASTTARAVKKRDTNK